MSTTYVRVRHVRYLVDFTVTDDGKTYESETRGADRNDIAIEINAVWEAGIKQSRREIRGHEFEILTTSREFKASLIYAVADYVHDAEIDELSGDN